MVIDELGGLVRPLSWVMPQSADGDASLSSFLVTVDEIEMMTGLDFFSLLNDPEEVHLESYRPIRM